ncbi:MAG: MFS transporter [Acidimicrobiia bacterium]
MASSSSAPFRPLGRRFWAVWTAATASNIGDGIVLAALPLLAATLTRDPLSVATTTIAVRLPWLLFGLFAGVIVDRTDRLRMMIATDVGRAAAYAAMAVVVVSDNMTLLILYLAVFGVGVLETLFDTAAMSITPSLVERDQLDHANARINGAQIAANEFAGPPLGAALFAIAAAAPFGVNAVTFVVSVAILLSVGGSFRPAREKRPSVTRDIRAGFGFLWREPIIRAFAIGAGVINLGYTAAAAVLVLHAQDNLGLDELGFGLLLASAAVGGVAGAQLAPRTIRRFGRRPSVLVSVVAVAAGIAIMGLANDLTTAAAGFALFGFAGEIWNVVSVTYRQSVTPDEMLGRVMSGFRVIAYGAFPVGAALGGVIASTLSLRTAFFVGAGIIGALLPFLALTTRHHSLDPAQ